MVMTSRPALLRHGDALYRDLSNGHIKTASMSYAWDIDKARDFLARYGAGLTPDMIEELKRQVRETIHQGMRPTYRNRLNH